jgi:ankyrin repeat protein
MRKYRQILRTWGAKLAAPVGLAVIFACVVAGLMWREYRRERRDRDLIAAIKKADSRAVATLLEQGANANALDRLNKKEDFHFWEVLGRVLSGQQQAEAAYGTPALWVDLAMAESELEDHRYPERDMQARMLREASIAEALIAHGADLSSRPGRFEHPTPLHEAAFLDWTELARILVARGAEVNSLQGGETPLMCAREENTAFLLQYGADPNSRTYEGKTALMLAPVSLKKANLLLLAGADPNAKDRDGRTPLMTADTPEMIDLLLRYRAKVNTRDKFGHTALYYLQHGKDKDLKPEARDRMIRLLKARGAREEGAPINRPSPHD